MIARVVAGVLAFAAVIGALVFGANLDQAQVPQAMSTTVAVEPARQDIACPGPLETPSGTSGTDPELGGAATDVERATYFENGARAVANGQASEDIIGAAVERVGGGDITGLAAITCTTPLTDQWLVGGSTAVGASSRLVLTNPSDVAVEAVVTAYGELGELDSRRVAIGPNLQEVVLLEGVVVDVSALAIHITSSGTGVVAAMQDSRLDGFQPFGTDWVVASALSTQIALPAVGTGAADAQAATVRLVSPTGGTASLSLSTPDGATAWEGVAALQLDPGVVIEVVVPAVDEGTVIITSDAPVAAGAIVTRTRAASSGVEGDVSRELRWVPGQVVDDDNERAVVSVGYDERAVVFSRGGGTFALRDALGGIVAEVAVGAGETVSLPVDADAGSRLTAEGAFTWVLVAEDGEFTAALAPSRTTIDPLDVVVDQRRYVPTP